MSDDDFLRNVLARIGERYGEYLLVVKLPKGRIAFKFVDPTWAMGAVQRVGVYLDSAQDIEAKDD